MTKEGDVFKVPDTDLMPRLEIGRSSVPPPQSNQITRRIIWNYV